MMNRFFLRRVSLVLLWLVPVISEASSVAFSGLKKTHPAYAEWLWQNCIDDATGPLTAAVFRQCLIDSRHFSEVTVTGSERLGYEAKVVERTTFLVLPQVKSERQGSVKYGAYLLDSHFLGRGILTVLGLSKGALTEGAFVFVNHKRRRYPFIIYAGYTKDELALFSGERERDGLVETRRIGRLMLGTRLDPDTVLYGAVRTESRGYESYDAYALAPAAQLHQLGTELNFTDQNYYLFFNEGWRARLQVYGSFYQEGSPATPMQSYELDFGYGLGLFGRHALAVQGMAGVVRGGVATDKLKRGGGAGFRGVPTNGIWAQEYATLAVDYHIPLWRAGFGTVTFAPFADRGYAVNRLRQPRASGFETERTDIWSYGVGGYVYFNKVAVPGLGLVFGHNETYGGNFFSFSLGVGN